MTAQLKDLMHDRADSLGAPDLDVSAIVRAGDRRVALRRTAVVAGGVAAAVTAAVALPMTLPESLTGGGDRAVESPIAAAFSAHQPSYALGSTVHVDGLSFDVGREVYSMVQTDAGVVFTDREGGVWSATGDAEPVKVGETHARYPRLEADGTRAAWMDREGEMPFYVVLDQATGDVVGSSLQAKPGMGWLRDEEDPAVVYAIDGDEVYVRDSRGLVAWNPVTDEQRVLGEVGGFTVDDVKGGLIAHGLQDPKTGETTYRVGPALGEGAVVPVWSGFALSADGSHLLGETDPDVAAIFDTRAGTPANAQADGYEFSVFYGWADADTYVGLGMVAPDANDDWSKTPIDLLSCDVGGECTVTGDDIGSQADGVVVPLGEPMDG